jgi:hypothetical protein
MIKNNKRGIHQTTMNEKGGARSSPAKQIYSFSSFIGQSPLLIKNGFVETDMNL